MTIMDEKRRSQIHIRWMIRRDMPAVQEIEDNSFEFPWLAEDFTRVLKQRDCIGLVADEGKQVLGFMVYQLYKRKVQLLNFAVAEEVRRQGIGTLMVRKLISKLSAQRRCRLLLAIREQNVEGQLFFKSCGVKAVDLLRGFYENNDDDAYLFEYRVAGSPSLPPPAINRISKLSG